MKTTSIKEPYFPKDVVSFVVAQRTIGRKWKDIQNEIRELHKVEPPCTRQMLLWFNQWGLQAKQSDSETTLPGFRARLLRLKNTYKYVSNDSAFNREVATAGQLLQLIDTIASHSPRDRENHIESIVGILALIERWSGKSTFDQAVSEYQLVRSPETADLGGIVAHSEKRDWTDEEKGAFLKRVAENNLCQEVVK